MLKICSLTEFLQHSVNKPRNRLPLDVEKSSSTTITNHSREVVGGGRRGGGVGGGCKPSHRYLSCKTTQKNFFLITDTSFPMILYTLYRDPLLGLKTLTSPDLKK